MGELQRSTEQPNALPTAWIERLFERLTLVYGTDKMMALWRGQELYAVKDYWAEELAGYSGNELRVGVEALRAKHPTWPPTLFEFQALCRPPVSVDPEAAFYEAVRGIEARRRGEVGQWSHRATYWAMVDVSAFDVSGSTWPQIRSRWTRAFEARLADANLPLIPEPPKALPAPEVPIDGNVERLQGMAESLAQVKRNPRGWVNKILERKERGDKSLPDIAYRMALDSEKIR